MGSPNNSDNLKQAKPNTSINNNQKHVFLDLADLEPTRTFETEHGRFSSYLSNLGSVTRNKADIKTPKIRMETSSLIPQDDQSLPNLQESIKLLKAKSSMTVSSNPTQKGASSPLHPSYMSKFFIVKDNLLILLFRYSPKTRENNELSPKW